MPCEYSTISPRKWQLLTSVPASSIIIDEQIPFFAASGLSAAVATVSMSSLGNMPTLPEEMPPMLADWTLAHDVAPVAPQTTGESPQECKLATTDPR